MAFKQKQVMEYLGIGFKVWVLCLLAAIIVAIIVYPILIVAGFALGAVVVIISVIIMFPLILIVTGYIFKKFYDKF